MDFLAGHAESLPDKPAVIDGDRVLDFGSLSRRASRVANVFTGLGCREGDRVAWMSFNSLDGQEIASGSARAGLVIVPVNYRLRGAEIAYILNDSGRRSRPPGPITRASWPRRARACKQRDLRLHCRHCAARLAALRRPDGRG